MNITVYGRCDMLIILKESTYSELSSQVLNGVTVILIREMLRREDSQRSQWEDRAERHLAIDKDASGDRKLEEVRNIFLVRAERVWPC